MTGWHDQLVEVRPVGPADVPFLWDMLWEAVASTEAVRAMGRGQALALPESRCFLEVWGRPGDEGVVTCDDHGAPLGAAWVRLFPDRAGEYGFVASDVPELAIGVVAAARRQGVGGALLDAVQASARRRGARGVSLAVDRKNLARARCLRKGCRDVEVSDQADAGVTMVVWF